MSALRAFGFTVLATAACGGAEVKDFVYGDGQPGFMKAEGGEIRHENVRIFGQKQTWIMVYQYTAEASVPTAPFPTPDPKSTFGNCVDERDPQSQTWPFKPITEARYLDLSKVTLTGPGINGTLNVPLTDPVNKVGNSTFRAYDVTYGGGSLTRTGAVTGFNAMLSEAEATAGGEYFLDIGKANSALGPGGTTMSYFLPEPYAAPRGIGGAATIDIPAHSNLDLEWTAPHNDKGPDGSTHGKKTYFNFTFFADPTVVPTAAAAQPRFICFPDIDGHTVIPAAVIDLLPGTGWIVHANFSHWMELRDTENGEQRRFDLVGIYSNVSSYFKQ